MIFTILTASSLQCNRFLNQSRTGYSKLRWELFSVLSDTLLTIGVVININVRVLLILPHDIDIGD